jgi:hypothetical protein
MAAAAKFAPLNVRALSPEKKIEEAIRRGVGLLPAGMKAEVQSFFTWENMQIIVATFLAWALAHATGVGEATDVLLLVIGVGFVGWGFWGGLKDMVNFAVTAIDANSEQDLNAAAILFQRGLITLGINTLMALLLKRPLKSAWARRGSLTQLNLRPRLIPVGPPPNPGVRWELVDPAELPKGTLGVTDPYGNVKISNQLSAAERFEVGTHEGTHSYLSPQAQLLRQFRASLNWSAYDRSVFLRYMEEAIAQTRARILTGAKFEGRVFTRSNALQGVRFPLAADHYAILERVPKTQDTIVPSDIRTQGYMIGAILVEGHAYTVTIRQGRPRGLQQSK